MPPWRGGDAPAHMSALLILLGVAFLLLLLASAFFSSAETALFSLDPQEINRIGEKNPHHSLRLRRLLDQPTRLLSTVLIGNTIVNVELWIVGALFLSKMGMGSETLQVVLLTLLTVIFGEYGPKRLAILNHTRMACAYARPLLIIERFLTVPRRMLESLTNRFAHSFRPSGHILTRAEYDTLMDAGGESGTLDEHEHKMVRAILSLERQSAADVMTPRVDLEGVDLDEMPTDIVTAAKNCGVRHLVLYRGQLDRIEGLLDVRAFLLDPARDLKAATIKPFYVPEFCTLDKLLTQMLTNRLRVVIVVDEYGGTAGLITRGDILEELTGVMDPDDKDRLVSEQLTETAWLLDGQTHLLDVERITGLRLEAETADRLAGWFVEQAEHIPVHNEIITGPGYRAMARQVRRHRIVLVLLERTHLEEGGGE